MAVEEKRINVNAEVAKKQKVHTCPQCGHTFTESDTPEAIPEQSEGG